jgi:hypothetical protein
MTTTVPHEIPNYMKISSTGIRIGKKVSGLHSAVSIASADAFFLVVGKNAFRAGMEIGGGALGALLGIALGRLGKRKPLIEAGSKLVETTVEDLPDDITGDPDWPAGIREGPVIVIPREAVVSVRYSFWQWGIFVQTEKVELRIEPPFFGRRKVLAFLREAGWDL